MPVSPMPPIVAQKASAFSSREQWRRSPRAVSSWKSTRKAAIEPLSWWFLPWTSAAIAPPIVTFLVPGVTGKKKPRGRKCSMMSARLTADSQVRTPVSGSKASIRSSRVVSTTAPRSLSEASP